MATADIRFKRMQGEYRTLQEAQDRLFDKVDGFEGAVLGLNEVVTENRERLERVEKTVAENRERLERVEKTVAENRERLERVEETVAENRAILLAIAERLDVTYEKPPMGFSKE